MTTITINRATVEQALEALEASRRSHYYCEDTWYSCPKHEDGCSNEMEGDECNCGADEANEKIDQSITALRAALAAPTAEPVAWMTDRKEMYFDKDDAFRYSDSIIKPLYLAPPQRKPLTEEEIDKVSRRWVPVAAYMGLHEHAEMTQKQAQQSIRSFARAIERAHGIGVKE